MQDLAITLEKKLKTNRLSIPSLPENAVKLRKLAANPNASIKDITELIGQDASTSAQIIRLAQTLRYSNPGSTITSLNTAVTRIGFQGTVNLVLAMTILQGYHFHSKSIHNLCKYDNFCSRLTSKYAMTAYLAINQNLPQEKSDFIALASIFLNIGTLPIYSELDVIERVSQLTIDNEQITKWKKELKVKFGLKILENWKFDPSFATVMDLKINKYNTCEANCVIYAAKFVENSKIEDLMPLSNEISDSFVPLPDSDYRDTFIEYLKTNGWLST